MGLIKNTLLGAGAALVSVAAAQAADLPSRKAAPVEYVRICDAYGRGFFYIPGTDTCIRIGGRVRADYAIVPAQTTFTSAAIAGVGPGARVVGAAITPSASQHVVGWEARGRISFDVRTQTAWGVVQAVASMRMARTTGVLEAAAAATGGGGGAGSTLEAAYIRFAGFTFGAARDNFASMPSLTYGAGHWASFANGAKQIAYTFSFGGGFAATLALQDYEDTNNAARAVGVGFFGVPGSTFAAPAGTYYVYNSIPQINGRLEWNQGWGSVTLTGAWANLPFVNNTATFDRDIDVWAIGGTVKFNLPMLASGSALWITGAYASGMTEYTINWASVKTSAYRRDVGGFQNTAPSVILTENGAEAVKSWNIAALLQHFWAPQWRSVLWGSYGQMDATTSSQRCAFNGAGCFGDTTVWNIGTNLAWLPTRDFEIGVEVIYARVEQNVRAGNAWQPLTTLVGSKSDDNVTGRLRVERNF